jgi:cobalamin biosynthesis Mg chelatase CobN
MFGTRQSSAPARGRSILALSTLALLALCCVPVLAYGSSAGFQYEDAPQTATGKPPSEADRVGSSPTKGVGSSAGKSDSDDGSSAGAKPSDEGSGGAATRGDDSGGNDAKAQQGSQAKDGKAAPAPTKPVSSNPEPGSEDGGTSPLILILIAILVLAVGSVAYMAIKRRRADESDSSGSPVSPEAS